MTSKISFFKSTAFGKFLDFLDVGTVMRFAQSHTLCKWFFRNIRQLEINETSFTALNSTERAVTLKTILQQLPHLHRLQTFKLRVIGTSNFLPFDIIPVFFKQMPKQVQRLDFGENNSKYFISMLLSTPLPELPHLEYLNLSSKISNVEIYTPENLTLLHSKLLGKCPMLKKINNK